MISFESCNPTKFILVVLVIVIWLPSQAQTDDNIIWAIFKMTKSLSDKTSIAVTPIVRINEDVSNYQNTSLDLSIRRKLGKSWHVQLLERTWFIPDQKIRQFLWVDVGWSKSFAKTKLASHVRLHHAMDINDRNDPDFIRWLTKFSFPRIGAFTPTFAIEPWLRLNNFNEIQRMRYEPGVTIKLADRLDGTAVWRRELSVNLEPSVKVNQFVLVLHWKL